MTGQHVEQPRLQVGIGTSGFVAVKIILQICFFSPPNSVSLGVSAQKLARCFRCRMVVPCGSRFLCGDSEVPVWLAWMWWAFIGWCRIFRTYHLCHWGYHLGLFSSSDNILSCFGSRECSFATLQISRSNWRAPLSGPDQRISPRFLPCTSCMLLKYSASPLLVKAQPDLLNSLPQARVGQNPS
jgi:hypothetical protein